jgi:hypothetical protein
MKIYRDHCIQIPKLIEYWRNPTKNEIRFGYGATHYREFDFDSCFDKDNILILKAKASDDNLIYYYTGQEYFTTSKAKLQK